MGGLGVAREAVPCPGLKGSTEHQGGLGQTLNQLECHGKPAEEHARWWRAPQVLVGSSNSQPAVWGTAPQPAWTSVLF